MKAKVIIPLVVIIAIGLGIALYSSRTRISEQEIHIASLSNRVSVAQEKVDELTGVNETLTSDLKQRNVDILALTNSYTQALATLAKSEADLKQTETSLKQTEETLTATKKELDARNTKIAELENQNAELDTKSASLSAAITNLTTQIAATQAKLAAAEGDKEFLQGELNRLMSEKTELEKQLNDIQFLKAQVAHLKAELSIAKRLEWLRKGLFNPTETKGAQMLIQKEPTKPKEDQKYDLNVEINADGSIKVIPAPTNAPTNP